MSEQTVQLVELIRNRLRSTARRITLGQLAFGAVLFLGVLAAIWLVAASLEAGMWLDTRPRMILFWILAVVASVLIVGLLLLPLLRLSGLLRGPSEESVAREIGKHYPEVSDRLVNLLHLVDGKRTPSPPSLVDRAVQSLGHQVRTVPFEQMEDFHRARKASRLASIPIVGVLVFLIVAPGTFLGATTRILSPGSYFQRPAPFQLSVTPGTVELVKGQSLDIAIDAAGTELPRQLTLLVNNMDEDLVDEYLLTADSTGAFHHSLVNVRKSLRYRVEASPVRTAWYAATVVERPLIRGMQVSLAFPGYSRIPPQRLEPNVGDVAALPGTRVNLDVGVAGQNVEEAFLVFDNGRTDTLEVGPTEASHTFTLSRAGTYHVVLRNGAGIENADPIEHTLTLLEDAAPSVLILTPEPIAELNDALRAALQVRINDDFGFSRLRLFYRLAESRYGQPQETFESLPLPLERPQELDQQIGYEWLINEETGLDLVPGDVIEYYVQVWDNDSFAGFKPSQSSLHRLRLPSLAEQYEQLDDTQSKAEDLIETMLRESQRIQDQYRELRDELRENPESDWEDQRQLEQLQQRQSELENQVDQLTEQLDSAVQQMENNNLVNEETLQMYEELQKVVEEIKSPELQEALQQLQEAMQDLNLEEMQESFQNFEMNEEQYKQRLERTLELFKQLRVQQRLDEAAKRAEELAHQQENLQEKTQQLLDTPQEQPAADSTGTPAQDSTGAPVDEQGNPEENRPNDPQDPGAQEQGDEGDDQASDENREESGENREGDPEADPSEQNPQGEPTDEQNPSSEAQEETGTPGDSTRQESGRTPQQELAHEQELSRQEMEQLEQQLQELMEQMEEVQSAPKQQMEKLNDQVQQQRLPQQMQQNAEELRQNDLEPAKQGQQQMQEQLQQLQQQLSQMQQNMQGQQMNINVDGLRRALTDILMLSQQQEELRAGVLSLSSESPLLRDQAEQQAKLSDGLRVVSDSLQKLARSIPQMSREVQQEAGEAMKEMSSSTEAMTERIASRATGHQKGAMTHLNELALLLSDLLNQMMNMQGGGSGSGMSMEQMIQQLQNAAQDQQKLNDQIQQMLNESQGNRLSTDMQERIRQMAAQQEAIRNQIKQLSRNRDLRGQIMGDLNRIAEQMEETINELQRGRPGRRLVERQRQILTRLLDTTKSLNERGREKRREGQVGDDVPREGPDALTPAERADQLRRALIEALESGYSPDYEELIKRYFELLQELAPQDSVSQP